MSEEHPVILVKRKKKHHLHSSSHGSWKIAYADFMTAMMAFFLVMWLISIASPQVALQIADYFRTPLKIALSGGKNISTSSNTIPGGGADPTQKDGEVKKSPRTETPAQRKEKDNFRAAKKKLESAISKDARFKELRNHLSVDVTNEGLRVQLIDSQRRPMFQLGSARIEPYMRDLLYVVAPTLNQLPNKISISGHTDNLPYAGGERGYSNWELSSDRANASRRELIAAGLAEGKVLRVAGMASVMSTGGQIGNPEDRRISILVLNKEAEAALRNANLDPASLRKEQEEQNRLNQLDKKILPAELQNPQKPATSEPSPVPVENAAAPAAASGQQQAPVENAAAPAASELPQPADETAAAADESAQPQMPAEALPMPGQ